MHVYSLSSRIDKCTALKLMARKFGFHEASVLHAASPQLLSSALDTPSCTHNGARRRAEAPLHAHSVRCAIHARASCVKPLRSLKAKTTLFESHVRATGQKLLEGLWKLQ